MQRESAVRRHRRLDPVTFAVRRVFEVRDHVFGGVVAGLLVDERQVTLPDAFDAGQQREPLPDTGVGELPEYLRAAVTGVTA